jgi:phage/plasmid-like protein (TIGR03299 family)
VLYRGDTSAHLGLVSSAYKIVQPKEVIEFFRDLVDTAGWKLETAGSLKGGSKVWAQAAIGDPESVIGKDLIRPYVLLATSMDGSMCTIASNLTTRVVCSNTLRIACAEHLGNVVKIPHRSVFNPVIVKAQLGAMPTEFAKFMHASREFARREISKEQASSLTFEALGETPSEDPSSGYQKIMRLFDGGQKGADLAGVQGTAWGYLNAVTEYVDHHIRARSSDSRTDSAWFGKGAQIKQYALAQVTTLI